MSTIGSRRLLPLIAVALTAACGSDDSTAPIVTTPTSTLTVDASQTFAYVKFGDPAQQVSVSDASTSSTWDIGFQGTTVTTNGGGAGPGGVSVHCLCSNANATTAELQAFTAENQEELFESVTASQIPGDASFKEDSLSPAISGWVTGSGSSAAPTPSRTWIVRSGTSSVILAKFRVTSVTSASADNAGVVAIEYAVQPSSGAPFGSSETKSIDVRNGPVYLDLTTGTTSTTAGTWHLRFSGYEIRTNGGVSGAGGVTAVLDDSTPFEGITEGYAGSIPSVAYSRDSFSGTFVSQPWYRYNVTGTDHQIWPLFNVYLVKRDNEVYKVQLISYYNTSGDPRHISFRYARLR